ncbi:MAG TPA: hypothetical protein IAB12_05740 [Candidatus Ornithospirochaeta avicola]|uniref:Outer membrane efflux protein n=1 Tax=Candidatus Ornithospirochaeta avicola TaxID=2840896 RepID=A0A9D1PTW8_9SPIO|nr:hypothetical protein [Candidatus Ornithospirochaeta avicola]
MRKIIILLLIAILPFSLFAADYSEIIAKAKDSSRTLENAEIAYQNSLLKNEEASRSEDVSYSVSAKATPINTSFDNMENGSMEVSELSASIVIPSSSSVKSGERMTNATTVTVSSPLSAGYDGAFSIWPSVSASHTFDLSSSEGKYKKTLQDSQNTLTIEQTYKNALLSFEKSIISQMQSILSTEKSIRTSENALEIAKKSMEDIKALGTYSEGSVNWRKAELEKKKTENSLSSLYEQYENAKEQFYTATGLEWNGLENIPEPNLELVSLESGNTDVRLSYIESELARLEAESSDTSTLSVSGSLGASYKNSKAKANAKGVAPVQNTVTGSAGVSYKGDNWSIGADVSLTSTKDFSYTPQLTISGSWSSSSTSDITEKTNANNAIKASNDYIDSLTNYTIEGMSLAQKINAFNLDYALLKEELEYQRQSYELTKESYDAGLASESELESAALAFENAEADVEIKKLEGLELEYDILIYSL